MRGKTTGNLDKLPAKSAQFKQYQMDPVKVTVKEKIRVELPRRELLSEIESQNTFANPIYESNELHGHSNWQTDPIIRTYEGFDSGISVPRGFLPDLLRLCQERDITPEIEDIRSIQPVAFPERLAGVDLLPYQARAVDQAMKIDQGVIVSPTGSGKSLIGLEIIRQRRQKTLIIVHRSDLLKQWLDVIEERLGIKASIIAEGEFDPSKDIVVGMVQTLASRLAETKKLSAEFGLVLVDEAHHLPAQTFYDVLGVLSAKHLYGLSATPGRRDGLELMIYRAVGPAIATISKKEVEELEATVPAEVYAFETGFNPGLVDSWHEYLHSITHSAERNLLIIDLAVRETAPVLVLCDRTEHVDQLCEMLTLREIPHVKAHGKISAKNRESIIQQMREARLTIATTSLVGEGLDVKPWTILIMASPISSEIKLLQAVGRVVRASPGKKEAIVYDLRDNCGFAGASFKKRFEIYKKNKIWVNFPR